MKSKTGQESKYREHLLSDINIYLAIYSLNSYIFEYNLLKPEDRHLYHQLQDKFDERLVSKVTEDVKKRIKQLLDDPDKFIQAKVYFKPKKLVDGKLEFRPLHTTDLITQIAIVSMLHLFVYEIPEKENSKLTLSNLSRLIPSDFYGNRVSVKPESLFKPWKQQYQKYNQNSNDALKKYHTSLEYKYEVTLDLENFFPTINPVIIYHYIIGYLPAHLSEQDMSLMKTVLRKLLFCELDFGKSDTTTFTEQLQEQYLKISKHKTLKSKDDEQQNTVNTEKTKDAEPPETAVKSRKFVRGIPQGLPQSYFLGNIYMIIVSEILCINISGILILKVFIVVYKRADVVYLQKAQSYKNIDVKDFESLPVYIRMKLAALNIKRYKKNMKKDFGGDEHLIIGWRNYAEMDGLVLGSDNNSETTYFCMLYKKWPRINVCCIGKRTFRKKCIYNLNRQGFDYIGCNENIMHFESPKGIEINILYGKWWPEAIEIKNKEIPGRLRDWFFYQNFIYTDENGKRHECEFWGTEEYNQDMYIIESINLRENGQLVKRAIIIKKEKEDYIMAELSEAEIVFKIFAEKHK